MIDGSWILIWGFKSNKTLITNKLFKISTGSGQRPNSLGIINFGNFFRSLFIGSWAGKLKQSWKLGQFRIEVATIHFQYQYRRIKYRFFFSRRLFWWRILVEGLAASYLDIFSSAFYTRCWEQTKRIALLLLTLSLSLSLSLTHTPSLSISPSLQIPPLTLTPK